jgi:nitrogen fixation-related uncharacterized protein
MTRPLGIGLLIVGVLLLYWGIDASNSFSSEVNELLTDSPSDRSMWLIGLGIVLGVVGLFAALKKP